MINFLLATVLSGCPCPTVYEYIHFDQPVKTKVYQAFEVNGRIVNVPVINGIIPEYQETISPEGIIVRNFYYKPKQEIVNVPPKETPKPPKEQIPVVAKPKPKIVEEKVEMVKPSTIGNKTHKFIIEYSK